MVCFLITGTTLGHATDSRTYNSELIGYTASANGAPAYSALFTRDRDGRVTGKTETIAGTTNAYTYTYDAAGRLTAATRNGATDTYTYDTNSNRLSATTASGTSSGSYDAQDRLLTYGNASYTYTANGELASQTAGGQKITYTYDVQGNLRRLSDERGVGICRGELSLILMHLGDLEGALVNLREEEQICLRQADLEGLAVCLGNQAGVLAESGAFEDALRLLDRQEQECADVQDPGIAERRVACRDMIREALGR